MKHKYLVIIFVFIVSMGCSLAQVAATQVTETPTSVAITDTIPPPLSKPELGTAENPLILALAPSSNSQAQVDAAKVIAAQLKQRTGYEIVVVTSDSYSALVDAFEKGNAHITLLDPLSYELGYQKGLFKAGFAIIKNGKALYGSQFIASRKGGFRSYFDTTTQTNTADASIALAQFANKKPCWSDETSPSGYVIPFGILNKNQIQTQPAAFVQGHTTVIRSIYAGGICDFGATYIDARKFPSLEDQYPDLMEQVIVIWHVPEIIPYSVLVFSTNMPQSMHVLFTNSIPAILQTDEGKAAFRSAYAIETLLPVTDADFSEFHEYIDETHLNLSILIR